MRAHTVILGAGATIAAIPNGDRNGKKSSVMNGLIEKLKLDSILAGVELHTKSNNLEDIYAELHSRPECQDVVNLLEQSLYDYFSKLKLPDEPTVYDYLVLCLTEKDVIATFNWDPLLIQAYIRCFNITNNLPHIYCLHGNVAIGYCIDHKEHGATNAECPVCGETLTPVRLLYPTANKDYITNEYISECWSETKYFLENSYMLTIFGYSAPSSDKEAVNLLKMAWGDLEKRQLEEVSIIDILTEEEITTKWKDFIYSHHYKFSNDFFSSYLGKFPRRSCETVFATFQFNLPPYDNMGFIEGMSWDDIKSTLSGVLEEELNTPKGKNYPLHYHK